MGDGLKERKPTKMVHNVANRGIWAEMVRWKHFGEVVARFGIFTKNG